MLAIVGPTAAGKSALAMRLATSVPTEIVNADSRQVYRHMDIGTAKPSPEEREAVPHHLIDIVGPDQEYSLALFLQRATDAIRDIHKRGVLPVLVGGTGQYVWALLEGWRVPRVPPDPGLRLSLEERARSSGPEALYTELTKKNPEAAARIDARNVRRVIRALEVWYAAPDARPETAQKPTYETRVIGLTMERSALYRRIDKRVDAMIAAGWVDEVRSLLERGYGPELPSMSSVGYGELVRHLNGELSLDEAVERIKGRTHRFARHQYAWFRPGDERIRWFNAETGLDDAEQEVGRWLETVCH